VAWRPPQRKRIMIKFADQILAHADELALTETLDMGKPIQYAKGGGREQRRQLHPLVWRGGGQGLRRNCAHPAHALALITREPVGVVGASSCRGTTP
jgi:acyl-CoA reductase-like NAD-dependent aldehyde dehydrogenase